MPIITDRYRIYRIMRDNVVLATFDPRRMDEMELFVRGILDDKLPFTLVIDVFDDRAPDASH